MVWCLNGTETITNGLGVGSDGSSARVEQPHAAIERQLKPLGRPANVSGDDTRRRILKEARELFAAYGYAATSNRMIAEHTGLSGAAIYHHFGRKSDLMRAIYEATEQESYSRLLDALGGQPDFIAKAQALLDVIYQIVTEDRPRATFMLVAREESRRHPELAQLPTSGDFAALFDDMVDQAIQGGQLIRENAKRAKAALTAIATGLARFGIEEDDDTYRMATDGVKFMIAGTLLKFQKSDVRRRARPRV